MNIVLQGLEQHFWKGTEAGWMGCYDFPGETWAGDGSVQMRDGGRKCLRSKTRSQPRSSSGQRGGGSQLTKTRTSGNRSYSNCSLQATSAEIDLLYLFDSKAALNKVSRWIGSVCFITAGPITKLFA